MGYYSFLKQSTLDIAHNLRRIWSLAVFEYQRANKDMFLGNLWKLLSPCIQIGAYWLVFGIGIRQGHDVNGFPFVVWLTCGITPWFIINQSISVGAVSVYRKASMLTKANISTVLIPISSVLSVAMNHAWTVALLFIIFLGNGCHPTWYILNIIYYFLFILIFASAFSLISSVFVMLARDFQKLIQMAMRLMFFVTPIFWEAKDNMPKAFYVFDAMNPIAYVVKGFRSSMLYRTNFWHRPDQILLFWGMTLLFYLIGIGLQRKLRNNILDYL